MNAGWDDQRVPDLDVVRRLTDRVADFITETFLADKSDDAIWLTKPLFLSCIDGSEGNGSSASSVGYSFLHVDRERERHFRYSALLYLDDGCGAGRDFEGGELVFAGRRRPPRSRPFTVSPRAGKLVRFALPSVSGFTLLNLPSLNFSPLKHHTCNGKLAS